LGASGASGDHLPTPTPSPYLTLRAKVALYEITPTASDGHLTLRSPMNAQIRAIARVWWAETKGGGGNEFWVLFGLTCWVEVGG